MSMTIAEFEALIGETYKLDAEITAYEKTVLKPMKARLDELEARILAQLEAEEMSSYKSKHGTVVRSRKYSVRVPQSAEDKEALFSWLRTKGDAFYYKNVSVNSQSLNSIYSTEMEIAKDEGNFDFAIPGVGLPEVRVTLSMRSK